VLLFGIHFPPGPNPLDGKGLQGVQEAYSSPDRQKLVCLNGVSHAEADGIYPWLDELLRDIGILQTDTGTGILASETDKDVLLETMAQNPNKSPKADQDGDLPTDSYTHSTQPKGVLASCSHLGNPYRYDK